MLSINVRGGNLWKKKVRSQNLVFFFVEILVSYSFLDHKHVFFFFLNLIFYLFIFFLKIFLLSVFVRLSHLWQGYTFMICKIFQTRTYELPDRVVFSGCFAQKKRFQLIYLRWNGEAPVNLRQPQRPTNGDAPVNLRQPTSPLAAAGDVSRTCSRRGLGGVWAWEGGKEGLEAVRTGREREG